MDPRLQSIHLEANPRREKFRQARDLLENAAGNHTLAGEIRPPVSPEDLGMMTMSPGQEPMSQSQGIPVCWLADRGKLHPLYIGLNTIGRLPDNHVIIDDACVSRRHCAIVVHSDLRCEIHDVASKNGTLVNGRKIGGPTRLNNRDEITLSGRRLTMVEDNGNSQLGSAQSANSLQPNPILQNDMTMMDSV
jgi:hypothetical protein